MASIPEQTIRVAKGSDWTRYIRVLDGTQVILSSDAATGATSLTLQPDHPALATGDKLLFGENVIVTTSGASAAGATSLAVTALVGPLKARAVGRRIVADLTTYDLEFRVLENRGDAEAILEIQGASSDDSTDPNSPKADIGQVTGETADTVDVAAGSYYWAVWNAAVASEVPLVQGTFELVEAGYIP